MPPKPKFTRDELIGASIGIVAEKGIDALTARELAHRLGCSTRPIFTVFDDMSELKREVRRVCAVRVETICSHAMFESGDFVQAVVEAVLFAAREPNLYMLVFMTGEGEPSDFSGLLQSVEVTEEDYLQFIREAYGLDEDSARTLFYHAWVHCLGMGVLCATRHYQFSEEELGRQARQDLEAMCAHLKFGREVWQEGASEADGAQADDRSLSWSFASRARARSSSTCVDDESNAMQRPTKRRKATREASLGLAPSY